MSNYRRLSLVIVALALLSHTASAQGLPKKGSPPQRIYGLTVELLDKLNVDKFEETFRDVPVPITLRIVFQDDQSPLRYERNLRRLHNPPPGKKKFHIVGLPFDSYHLKKYKLSPNPGDRFDCGDFQGPYQSYDHRAKCFVEYFTGARDYIDAWEVGNEVNGEWADEDYKPGLPPDTKGKPELTVEKISRLINFIPAGKPTMLTVSYMPKCHEWTANAMDVWIENFPRHMPKATLDRIDYVLVSYYENNCNFHILGDAEINDYVFKPLSKVFPGRFLGIGEIGYSDGDTEKFKSCSGDKCYCSKEKMYCSEADYLAQNGKIATCKKSKTSQMQRYYGIKPSDPLYVGGGFWWNAGKDYKVGEFREALKKQFACLAAGGGCETHLPVDCPR